MKGNILRISVYQELYKDFDIPLLKVFFIEMLCYAKLNIDFPPKI